jgi:hypothetical protein
LIAPEITTILSLAIKISLHSLPDSLIPDPTKGFAWWLLQKTQHDKRNIPYNNSSSSSSSSSFPTRGFQMDPHAQTLIPERSGHNKISKRWEEGPPWKTTKKRWIRVYISQRCSQYVNLQKKILKIKV